VAVPWTRRTGGAAAVGLPPGHVNAAARVAAFTEKGASPAKAYVGAALFATGAAAARVKKREVATERILNEGIGMRGFEASEWDGARGLERLSWNGGITTIALERVSWHERIDCL